MQFCSSKSAKSSVTGRLTDHPAPVRPTLTPTRRLAAYLSAKIALARPYFRFVLLNGRSFSPGHRNKTEKRNNGRAAIAGTSFESRIHWNPVKPDVDCGCILAGCVFKLPETASRSWSPVRLVSFSCAAYFLGCGVAVCWSQSAAAPTEPAGRSVGHFISKERDTDRRLYASFLFSRCLGFPFI